MQTGDVVEVTNLDGETATGQIVEIDARMVSEYPANWMGPDDATLADYWRGEDIDPDAPVVVVLLGETAYPYPADRVEVLDETTEVTG